MDANTPQQEENNENVQLLSEDIENSEQKRDEQVKQSEQGFTEEDDKYDGVQEIKESEQNVKESHDEHIEIITKDKENDVATEEDEVFKQDEQIDVQTEQNEVFEEQIYRDDEPTFDGNEKLTEHEDIISDNEQKYEDEIQELEITEIEPEETEDEEEEDTIDTAQLNGKEIEEIYVQSFSRKSAQDDDDDDISDRQFNIFGEPRASQLGPVVSLSSTACEEEEDVEGKQYDYFNRMSIMETDLMGYVPEKEEIDRDAYIEEYQSLVTQRGHLRRKNGFLNRKMAEFYIKRKMDRVFDDITSDYEEILLRYERKIDEFYEYRDVSDTKKNIVKSEINELLEKRNEYKAELDKILSEMLDREKETSMKLVDTKTGKPVSEKVVEKYILRQYSKIDQIAKVRCSYLRGRERIREVEEKVKALETIGGTLHLIDFEQIRMDNQMTADKLEEREAELLKLRNRYACDVLAIAHTREKTAVVESQIADLNEEYMSVEHQLTEIREELSKLKVQRDANRNQTKKLKEESGLLPYTNLLIDFEECINLADKYKQEIKDLKDLYKETRRKVAGIKYTIENTEHINEDSIELKPMVAKQQSHYYRNKPNLTYPILPKITHMQQSV